MTRAEWEQLILAPAREKLPAGASDAPASPAPVNLVCTPEDVAHIDYDRDIADPGQFPFTRGSHSTGYQDRPWIARPSAAAGTPVEANAYYRHLLASGATGLSLEFDRPTLMGHGPDSPPAAGAGGRRGVSVASVDDMCDLLAGIHLGAVPVTMAINGPAPMVFALFLVAAERRGVDWSTLSGTLQHDVLNGFLFPSRPTMRLMTDVIAFCRRLPRWSPLSVSGCQLRDAGATAQQELSFTVCHAIACVGHAIDAGLDVDEVGSGLSMALSAHGDFFEDVAKHRAARQVWARVMRERFGATTDAACALRLHTLASPASLATHEPSGNVVRTTYQALAAVLGGTDSLQVNAVDNAAWLPTGEAATLALRTQQVLANECGLSGAVDPFGGSWWVERLTRDFVDRAFSDIDEIDRLGGMVAAVEQGVPQRQVAEAARRTRAGRVRSESGPAPDIGERPAVLHPYGSGGRPVDRARAARHRGDVGAVAAALDRLRLAASGRDNTMDAFIDCARVGATVGEMCQVLRTEWGEYVEPVTT
jgi:methylmalonyl-CoA mutase N-terminal domain/subunit